MSARDPGICECCSANTALVCLPPAAPRIRRVVILNPCACTVYIHNHWQLSYIRPNQTNNHCPQNVFDQNSNRSSFLPTRPDHNHHLEKPHPSLPLKPGTRHHLTKQCPPSNLSPQPIASLAATASTAPRHSIAATATGARLVQPAATELSTQWPPAAPRREEQKSQSRRSIARNSSWWAMEAAARRVC